MRTVRESPTRRAELPPIRNGKVISAALGDLDLRLVRIRPVEDDGMSHDATNRGPTGFTQGLRCGLLVRGLAESNLDQLMACKRFVERALNRFAHAAFADEDDRLQRMGETPQMPTLSAVQGRGGRRRRGC